MIEYIEFGNIFNLKGVNNYAHGCNCVGAMGKGIAIQFKQRFPEMYKEYKQLCSNGHFQLGDLFTYNYGIGCVFNLATQSSWKSKANIDAIQKSIEQMLIISTAQGIKKIALPKIGAGLGGLEWSQVNGVLKKISDAYVDVNLIVVENYQKASSNPGILLK